MPTVEDQHDVTDAALIGKPVDLTGMAGRQEVRRQLSDLDAVEIFWREIDAIDRSQRDIGQ